MGSTFLASSQRCYELPLCKHQESQENRVLVLGQGGASARRAYKKNYSQARSNDIGGVVRARFNLFGMFTQLLHIEWPPQNHTQGPNFCTLWPLLAYKEYQGNCGSGEQTLP